MALRSLRVSRCRSRRRSRRDPRVERCDDAGDALRGGHQCQSNSTFARSRGREDDDREERVEPAHAGRTRHHVGKEKKETGKAREWRKETERESYPDCEFSARHQDADPLWRKAGFSAPENLAIPACSHMTPARCALSLRNGTGPHPTSSKHQYLDEGTRRATQRARAEGPLDAANDRRPEVDDSMLILEVPSKESA